MAVKVVTVGLAVEELGGPSIGIAHTGTAPAGTVAITTGTPGTGGLGGNNSAGNKGADGAAIAARGS